MSNIKNPLFQKDIRNKIKSTDYVDSENPNIPKQKKNPPFFQFYKGAVMISQNSLAKFFNVTPRTIRNWIDWLDDNDMISIFKIGTANVYAINSAIVSDRLVTEKQNFALFNACVVADTISNNNQLDLIEQIKEIETTK